MRVFGKGLILVALLALTGVAAHAAEDMEGGIPLGDTGADVALTPVGSAATTISGLQGDRPLLMLVFLPG